MSTKNKTSWEIIDNNGVIHSGTEEEMRTAFYVMTHTFEEIKTERDIKAKAARDLMDKYDCSWVGDLKLVEVHGISK